MSLTTILSEIWRFIKENIFKILIGALIIGVLAILSTLFLPDLMNQGSEEEVTSEEGQIDPTISDEDVTESYKYLTHIYKQKPAEFEIFIQLEDGNTFTNSFVFDEYFTSPAVVEAIENQTGVEYSQTLNHEENLGLYKSSQYRGSIAGIRNTSSNVITIRVQAAESGEDNLALAEAFADMIVNNEVPFIEGLEVTWLNAPSIGESLMDSDLEKVSSLDALGTLTPVESESHSIILYGAAGFIVGLIITTIILFIIQLFSNRIRYAFQYSWDFNDYHFLYSRESGNEKLKELLLYPKQGKKMIVHQDSSIIEENIINTRELKTTNSLLKYSQNNNQLDAIVLFIESDVTDKEWYNEQYNLAEMYDGQITIIQVIN